MFDRIREDVKTVRERDPAARSAFEAFFLYPGTKAVRMHRRANWFYRHNFRFLARWISQRAARKTGIEIHPAAKIGRRFFIDHGTGVVIGETTEIGDDVKIAAGAVVLDDIPSDTTAVGVPARVVRMNGERVDYLDQIDIPDPIQQELDELQRQIEELKNRLDK